MGWKDEARQRVKEKKQGASFKLVEGENTFRILPNKKGPNYPPFHEYRVHREVGPDKEFMTCGKDIMGNGKCWLCDVAVPNLAKNPSKQGLAEEISAREQFLVQVSRIDPDNGKFSMPKPWWVSNGKGIPGRPSSRSLAVTIQSMLASSKANYEDPKRGRNINITRTGTGQRDTRYDPPIPDNEPTVVPAEVLKNLKDFTELFSPYNKDEQYAAFYGKPKPERTAEPEPDEPEEEAEETEEEDTDTEETDAEETEEEYVDDDAPEDDAPEDEPEEEEPEEEYEPEPEEEEVEPEPEPEEEPIPSTRRTAPATKPKSGAKPGAKVPATATKKHAPPPAPTKPVKKTTRPK